MAPGGAADTQTDTCHAVDSSFATWLSSIKHQATTAPSACVRPTRLGIFKTTRGVIGIDPPPCEETHYYHHPMNRSGGRCAAAILPARLVLRCARPTNDDQEHVKTPQESRAQRCRLFSRHTELQRIADGSSPSVINIPKGQGIREK